MIKQKITDATGIKFFIEQNGHEVARAYLYILRNNLHAEPFGFMEDVYVDESLRGQGIGSELVNELIETARAKGCYKIVATSRHARGEVHDLYLKLGFKDHGKEFRYNL